MAKRKMRIWTCKIGVKGDPPLPLAADVPMREAIAHAFKEVVGFECDFIFSGWGGVLTKSELDCVSKK
jgi:hypothetical protein